MKSLEILDKNTDWYGDVFLKASEVETIKQDLEVLEILRKYLYLYNYIADVDYGDREDRTIQMNMIEEMVSNWDYTQVKQWLEVNE